MKILIDKPSCASFHLIRETKENGDQRYYYVKPGAIIVCRNGLTLSQVAGRIVDAAVGYDIAAQGYASEDELGKKRKKITIYRILMLTEEEQSLLNIINGSR